ncbi:uncharacterized protein SPAPADRAFT_148821 [Spathaspora passalidarum NRRL Y-27907]|uniref:RING-type domain-containing protein n=1 Tax=Spathaspora passalidarum (strain NRRL Y-27907 / 11-Y1) TaxID=619300 RepID=G3AHS5_SPAPN|nr:uncharacterized protein SPAPADRAFT_148821 [Spathaspora passalidarum NRRL Y-27907]EGW34239.1 hypothetical protein SPAPADRAFT_148821 [Spathaspora passalidarum NRRL Y-27907]
MSTTSWRIRIGGAFGAVLGYSAYKRLKAQGSKPNLHQYFNTLVSLRTRFNPGVQFFVLFLCLNFLKWITFGKLTPREIKNLKDKIAYTIWEFFFGFMILYFKIGSYSIIQVEVFKFAGLFFTIILLKGFHYLSADRIQTVFNLSHSTPTVKLWAIKLSIGLIMLNLIDAMLIVKFFYELYHSSTNEKGLSMVDNILVGIFGFEILNLFPVIVLTTLKCGLELSQYLNEDEQEDTQWREYKLKWIYMGEFIVNLIRFIMVCLFSVAFLYFYTFPIHILPSSYLSLRVLVAKTRNFINFKKKQFVLEKLTVPTEVFRDEKCVVCFEEFTDVNDIRQLNCTHSFHYRCLKSWIYYSNSCPTCREVI